VSGVRCQDGGARELNPDTWGMVITWANKSLTEHTVYAEKNQKLCDLCGLLSVCLRHELRPNVAQGRRLRDNKKLLTIKQISDGRN